MELRLSVWVERTSVRQPTKRAYRSERRSNYSSPEEKMVVKHMALEQLLMAQGRIARLGEKSQMHWWESDAHGKAGTILLSRLFPKTAAWAAVELAMDTALAAHKRDLPAIRTITLFDLEERVNGALRHLLLQNKNAGAPTDAYSADVDTSSLDLGRALVEAGLTVHRHLQTVRGRTNDAISERVVCVGDVSSDADFTDPAVFGLLVAGYQFSAPNQLIVPYLRVIG